MNAIATAGGIPVGIAAAPAAPQSTAEAPAPASTAAPWLIVAVESAFKQTSTEPPVAALILARLPCAELTAPPIFLLVRRIAQPCSIVMLTALPPNVTVTRLPGEIQILPRPPSRMVAPTPAGVSIVAPLGMDAPDT